MSAAERTRTLEQTDITIDIGATSRDEVMNVFGIQPR
jgi:putative aminopeptidase FrvX